MTGSYAWGSSRGRPDARDARDAGDAGDARGCRRTEAAALAPVSDGIRGLPAPMVRVAVRRTEPLQVRSFPIGTQKRPSCEGRLHNRWWRGWDLNPRPSGYEPDELPNCSTPRREVNSTATNAKLQFLSASLERTCIAELPGERS